jgi:hypothetical protein
MHDKNSEKIKEKIKGSSEAKETREKTGDKWHCTDCFFRLPVRVVLD